MGPAYPDVIGLARDGGNRFPSQTSDRKQRTWTTFGLESSPAVTAWS